VLGRMLHLSSQRPTLTSPVLRDSNSRIPTDEPFERNDGGTMSGFVRSSDPDERIKDAIQSALSTLEREWVVLGDFCFVARGEEIPVHFIALHSRKGVALIDVGTEGDPAASSLFRLLLRSCGFEQDFPGYLPIVHLQLSSSDVSQLSALLDQAFSAEAPIGVVAEGWTLEVSRLLTQDPTREQTGLPAVAALSPGRRGRGVILAIGFSMLLLVVATALFLNGGALDDGFLFAHETTAASVHPPLPQPPMVTAPEPGPSTSTSDIALQGSDASERAPSPGTLPAEVKADRATPDPGSNGASSLPRRADPPAALPDGRPEPQTVDQAPKGPQQKASRPSAKGRVQLAAADTITEAERVWADLQAAQPDVLGEVRVAVSRATLADGRVVYRLQTASMTAEEAQRLCETLHRRQVPCFVRR
jgi:hypothetical protein